MKRRALLGGLLGGGVVLGGGVLLRPRDAGVQHTPYFLNMQRALQRDGSGMACLVLDLDRLNHNLIALREHFPSSKAYRLASKSLPCMALIDRVQATMHSERLMVFTQPGANAIARAYDGADLLFGKPQPIRSVERFYERHQRGLFDPQRQMQWLVDTPERLTDYARYARAQNLVMRINIELDVGMRRGGVRNHATLVDMLTLLRYHRAQLRFSGFTGYDAHVARMGTHADVLRAQSAAHERYRQFINVLRDNAGDLLISDPFAPLTFNAAGSANFFHHTTGTPSNDLAVGSALMRPSDYDIEALADFQPALFIAAPVLRTLSPGLRPGREWRDQAESWWNPNRRVGVFIDGGHWPASPVSPARLTTAGFFGRGGDQRMLHASHGAELTSGDYVFLRPQQSATTMPMFTTLLVIQAGRVADVWPLLPRA